MSFSPGSATCPIGWSVRRCLRSIMPPVLCLDIGSGRESRLATVLVTGEYVHRMLPELGHVRQRVVGILAVEGGPVPGPAFVADRIVDHVLDDHAWTTSLVAGAQQG